MIRSLVLAVALLCGACGSNEAPRASADEKPTPVAAAPAAKGRYAPRDECAAIPGAADFRQRLVEAVQLRDAKALAALADPAIKLDFGGGGGIDALRQQLASGDELWKSLEELMKLGCAKGQQGGIVMPWLFGQELGAIDTGAAMLVMGEDVPVLPKPSASAKPVSTISWDVVQVSAFDPNRPFQPLSLPLKQEGWIATDKLRSLLDYRLLASDRSGAWKIEALVAGD